LIGLSVMPHPAAKSQPAQIGTAAQRDCPGAQSVQAGFHQPGGRRFWKGQNV